MRKLENRMLKSIKSLGSDFKNERVNLGQIC